MSSFGTSILTLPPERLAEAEAILVAAEEDLHGILTSPA